MDERVQRRTVLNQADGKSMGCGSDKQTFQTRQKMCRKASQKTNLDVGTDVPYTNVLLMS